MSDKDKAKNSESVSIYEFEARLEALKMAFTFSKEYGDLTAETWALLNPEERMAEFEDLFAVADIFKSYLLKVKE